MADLPGLTYGRITGRFAALVADTADAGENPDVLPLSGQITFTPQVGPVKVVGATPPIIVAPTAIVAELDADGDLSINGTKGVYLVATDGPTSPNGWVYRVAFRLTLNGQAIDMTQLDIAVPGGSQQDLALLVPISGGGTITPQPLTVPQQIYVGGTTEPVFQGPGLWYKEISAGVYELWIQKG